jgi:hypothetical protein
VCRGRTADGSRPKADLAIRFRRRRTSPWVPRSVGADSFPTPGKFFLVAPQGLATSTVDSYRVNGPNMDALMVDACRVVHRRRSSPTIARCGARDGGEERRRPTKAKMIQTTSQDAEDGHDQMVAIFRASWPSSGKSRFGVGIRKQRNTDLRYSKDFFSVDQCRSAFHDMIISWP